MRSYAQRMERLVEVVQETSRARTLEAIIDIAARAGRDLTGADGATIVLRDGDQCHYVNEDAISPLWKGQRFPMQACISGWVMLNAQSAFIEDIYKDARIPAEAYRPTFVKSLAMVPVRTHAPIGAMGNYWATEHVTSPEEIRLLESLANTIAIALENLSLQAKLERSHQLFNAFMNHAPFSASIRDSKGGIIFANPRMGQLLGKSPDDLVGVALADVTGDAEVAKISLADDQEVIRTGKPSVHTFSTADASGVNRHLLVTKFPIPALPGETQIGLVSIDITERVEAERARELARVQLQQSYKMAALGEMAGGIAHEINNPMAIIIGKSRQLAEILETRPQAIDLAREFAGAITKTANRVVGITNGLRNISRRADRDPHIPVDLSSIVDGTVALAVLKFSQNGVTLDVTRHEPDLIIECRPPEISQVLLNLLSNALDAVGPLEDRWVKLEVLRETDNIVIAVTDSGTGIPRELQHKIMEPFFTTKEFGKGTGLGLSISRGIIENHGGTLTVDPSSPNTRFMMRLPLRGRKPDAKT